MKTRSAIGKASMMALLMALLALWATVTIAGLNEDLIKASERGDLPQVKRLLAKGAEVNAKTEFSITALIWPKDGRTALMAASERGHREVVQLLLATGAEV